MFKVRSPHVDGIDDKGHQIPSLVSGQEFIKDNSKEIQYEGVVSITLHRR